MESKTKDLLVEGFDGDLTLADLENNRVIQDSDSGQRLDTLCRYWTELDGVIYTS